MKFLSYGERRQLELALALASNPKVVLLDEPCAGLSPSERQRFSGLIRELPRDITLVMIEHDIDIALALADRVTVLHRGNIILDGTPDEVKDQRVRCGRSILAASEPLLSVRDVHTYYGDSYVLHGLSLELQRGRIICILGRNGMGKTTLIRTIAGTDAAAPGRGDLRGPRVSERAALRHRTGGRCHRSAGPPHLQIALGTGEPCAANQFACGTWARATGCGPQALDFGRGADGIPAASGAALEHGRFA